MSKFTRQQILDIVGEFATPQRPIFLVGGAVRDLLLDRPAHDLDFVLAGETRSLANRVAARLDGALYMLDEERSTTRVILEPDNSSGSRMILDFAAFRANDLEGDLRARDFTINAMAVDVTRTDQLIDPTGGFADLREKRIRACLPTSLEADPARALRAVRQALGFHFRIDPETIQLIRQAAPHLPQVSAERLRDELFRILDGPQVSLAIRVLDQTGVLPYLLPELDGLKGVTQSAPHTADVWEHTLSVVQYLEQLLAPLVGTYQEEAVADITDGSAVLWLGRYRKQFAEHFEQSLVPDRSMRGLLFFAALYHDISKPETRTVGENGKTHFYEHPDRGARAAATRGRALALSAAEVDRIQKIVAEHMRVHFIADNLPRKQLAGQLEPNLPRRTIYRYFKATGDAGVDICLFSLADMRGTYGVTLPQNAWEAELQACRVLLESYWEKNEEVVAPPRFLSGHDLITEFHLKPGKQVGELLEAIRETQAEGKITDREQALDFAKDWLAQYIPPETP